MKSKVLNRPMFNKGGAVGVVPEDMVENVGIMQGFMDDDYEEDEYEDEATKPKQWMIASLIRQRF